MFKAGSAIVPPYIKAQRTCKGVESSGDDLQRFFRVGSVVYRYFMVVEKLGGEPPLAWNPSE